MRLFRIHISSSRSTRTGADLRNFRNGGLEGYSDTVRSFFSNATYLEIVPKTVSKGEAVRWMCDYLGIPIENSVAAGDDRMITEMLKAAHVGAVMCNAFPWDSGIWRLCDRK